MATILISHGYDMTPDQHWYPWLRDQLTADGHTVVAPALPGGAGPDPDVWRKTLLASITSEPAQTVLVGHSLGGVNLLRLLHSHDTEARGAFRGVLFVASMVAEVGYDQLAGFFRPAFDWPRIRRAAHGFRALHAADDPVTGAATAEHVMAFATRLGAEVSLTPDGGHFPSPDESMPQLPEAARLVRVLIARESDQG